MIIISRELQVQFVAWLRSKGVDQHAFSSHLKWLRYYLDFCEKYSFPPGLTTSLPQFIHKLQEKKQTEVQLQQARHTITLYYELLRHKTFHQPVDTPQPKFAQGHSATEARPPQISSLPQPTALMDDRLPSPVPTGPLHQEIAAPPQMFVSQGTSWRVEYSRLSDEIKLRHYSPKTHKAYLHWVRRYQAFTRSRDPKALSTRDVKEFLTHLAVDQKVSASTQNQAFNSLLFFHRHVLKMEFGQLEGAVRAKRKPYIPVVLSRVEIDAVVNHLSPPYDLVVKLLYGCGLRLFECLQLRVQCFNFDAEVLTVHDGKGQKDRTVPLPRRILPELQAHLESLKGLHQRDLDQGYAGVFLINALEKKYPSAARDFVWQWFFPAMQLTRIPATGENRRYHLHESLVQKAIKKATGKARITKRASAHTFRHYAEFRTMSNYLFSPSISNGLCSFHSA